MNKKFLSAILFGALMVTSTGTFVSCKDYDDEIKELQGQVSSLATKSDVEAKLTQLQAAIDAAKAESASNAAKIAALTKCECDVDAMMAEIKDAVDADMAGYKADIEALVAQVEALVGEIADFVTSVELNYQGENKEYALDFYSIREKANVFEDGLTGALTFEENKQVNVGKTPVIVRVSPTNAVLLPEMISLVNSKGENLDEYVEFKVEKFTDLLSRAATNNGLWKITPVLKKYDKDQFAAMKSVKVAENDINDIQYAIQVNNSLTSAEARYATSAYDITFGKWTEFEGKTNLTFKVDDKKVDELNNRFTYEKNNSLKNFTAPANLKMYKELVWADKAATAPIMETKDDVKKNVADATKDQDNRAEKELFLAVQGKKFTISISDYSDKNEYAANIAGLYVTLDKQANAVESAPSEWNAWNKYTYTGLNTVVEGTSIEVSIDSEETINDIIGFRVYAVNLDGTLVDPDGRAFYALVGEQAAETQAISATVTPVKKQDTYTVKVALTAAQTEVITEYVDAKSAIVMDANNPVISKDYPVEYTVSFNKKDSKAVEAVFSFTYESMKNMVNDKTYKAVMTYKDETGFVLGEINLELTKTMPTEFPEDFAFRPKQETTEGSGKFIAYMIPANNSYVVEADYATAGIKDLDNVFYGLDAYYQFQFATSKYNEKDKVDEDSELVTNAEGYVHTVATKYIDNETAHAVSVWYTYPGISTYAYTDKDG